MILMDIITPISAATATVILLLSVVYYFMKNRDIVPGPKGVPYFGLYPVLTDEKCHLQLQEIGKKYGDLYSFTYLGKLIINLGSAKAIREVHINKSECFSGRFEDFNILTHILEDGVAMTNGDAWKSLRKFFIRSFKEFGLPVIRDKTSGPMYESLSQAMEDLRARNDEPFNIINDLLKGCTGAMRRILFGDDAVSEETVLKMNAAYNITIEAMAGVKMLLLGPVGRLLFHIQPGLRKALEEHQVMRDLLVKAVKSVEESMDENHITCVVEDFYKERNVRKRQNDPTWKHFSDKALVSSLSQMVGDGVLGVASFIGCFLYALVKYPEEQNKIYKELMEVIGPDRSPTAEDKNQMPYTSAFMNEVMRTSNFFPLFPSMECTKETTIRGYRIPKGAITMLNIWQSHHDPEVYENPEKFDASRFIPTEGKPRPELPVQFGMGKRGCTGEPFVTTQAFLFLTSIVKNFILTEPEKPTTKSELFLMTGDLELCIHPRSEK